MQPPVQQMLASSEATTSPRSCFWVGMEAVKGPLGMVIRGPLFVEPQAPAEAISATSDGVASDRAEARLPRKGRLRVVVRAGRDLLGPSCER